MSRDEQDERDEQLIHSHPFSSHSSPILWGITDGSAGMQSQVEGVLRALGEPYVLKTCRRKLPFAWLPAACWRGALSQLDSASDVLVPPWPQAVITSGRRSAALGLAVKAASGGKTRAIHLTEPRSARARFDLVVAMQHDDAAGANIIKTRFALHRVTPQALQEAAAHWQARFAHLPKPWIAVLVGGSTNRYTLSRAGMQHIISQVERLWAGTQGSLLITASRRTGEANAAMLAQAFAGRPRVFLHEGGENPYLGMLALAEHIVATNDSVNMISEAYATGKPLHILRLPGHVDTGPARFAEGLIHDGIARPLSLPLETWRYEVADEMPGVVGAIKRLLA